MNLRTTIIALLALALIIALGIASVFLFSQNKSTATASNTSSPWLPVFGSKTSNVTPSQSGTPQSQPGNSTGMLEVRTKTGTVSVKDFTKTVGVTTSFDENFYVSYPADQNSDLEYEINYLSSDHTFTVVLAKEPIGEMRRKAADDLAQRLGVSASDLCALDALVVAPRWVSDYYADQNLGFPGCANGVRFEGDPAS